MGISESKLLASRLNRACVEADERGSDQVRIDNILSDNNVIKCLRTLWKALPPDSKSEILNRRQQTSVQKATTQSGDITLPSEIKDAFNGWKDNAKAFLVNEETTKPDFRHVPLAQAYRFLSQVESQEGVQKIRRRILLVFFSRLKSKFPTGDHETLLQFARIIVGSGLSDDTELVRNKLSQWVSDGSRYDSLASDLGGLGSLFLLPDVGNSIWEQRIPKKSVGNRKEAIANLKTRGICKEAQEIGAHEVANTIMNYLFEKVESATLIALSKSPLSFMNSSAESPTHGEHIRRKSRKRKASSTRITNKRVRRDGVLRATNASVHYEPQFSNTTTRSTPSNADFVEGEVEGANTQLPNTSEIPSVDSEDLHTGENTYGLESLDESAQATQTSSRNRLNADNGFYSPQTSDNAPQFSASSAGNFPPVNGRQNTTNVVFEDSEAIGVPTRFIPQNQPAQTRSSLPSQEYISELSGNEGVPEDHRAAHQEVGTENAFRLGALAMAATLQTGNRTPADPPIGSGSHQRISLLTDTETQEFVGIQNPAPQGSSVADCRQQYNHADQAGPHAPTENPQHDQTCSSHSRATYKAADAWAVDFPQQSMDASQPEFPPYGAVDAWAIDVPQQSMDASRPEFPPYGAADAWAVDVPQQSMDASRPEFPPYGAADAWAVDVPQQSMDASQPEFPSYGMAHAPQAGNTPQPQPPLYVMAYT